MFDYEMYAVLIKETGISISGSIAATFFVPLMITGSIIMGLIATGSVVVVDLFLVALISLSDLDFNNVIVVHLIASLGISVLYASGISQSFLLVEAPEVFERPKERIYKAQVALARKGSSMLHGCMASLLAVGIVGFSRESYFFDAFFKLWIGIICFGALNAFVLVPLLLSFVGPTPDHT